MTRNLVRNLYKFFYNCILCPQNIFKGFSSIKKYGIRYTFKKIISPQKDFRILSSRIDIDLLSQGRVYILTTKHCYFIANLIKLNLAKLNIVSEVVFERPIGGFGKGLHFVVCPQMFHDLPEHYVAFQLEQSVSSRWFTDEYLAKLRHAYAIFDYSLNNLEYLQNNEIPYQQIYFMPLSYQDNYRDQILSTDEIYDVLFYGDVNNPRRKAFLQALSKNFNVKVIKNVFAENLYAEIQKAKIVINIHYYEDALLETTRLYECLSLHKLIISERSDDCHLYKDIQETVDFVDVGDINKMSERIAFWLSNDNLRSKKIADNIKYLQQGSNLFEFYFLRFMLANDWIEFEQFYRLAGKNITFNHDFVCLGLPESVERAKSFAKDNKYNIQVFPGLRHSLGWIGCGMSYKFIFKKAQELGWDMLTICEDDVQFYTDFARNYQEIKDFLKQDNSWDLFSGLIADVSRDVNIKKIVEFDEREYLFIDKMTSMVFNIYSHRFYHKLLAWDETNRQVQSNTIDRYIESHGECITVTTLPYMVGHKENVDSTLWGIHNDVYTEMIKRSEKKLSVKLHQYKDNNA